MVDDDNDEREVEFPQPRSFPYDGWDKPSPARKPGKTYSPHYKGDNAGGYGNPPVSGQRKKGDPGGPGRPKGSTSLHSAFQRAFRRKLPTVRDGKAAKLHPTDVFAERVLGAILGTSLTPGMIDLGRRLLEQFGPQMPEPKEFNGDLSDFSEDESGVLLDLLNRYIGEPPDQTRRHVLGMIDEPYPVGVFRLYRRDDGHLGLERLDQGDARTDVDTPE